MEDDFDEKVDESE